MQREILLTEPDRYADGGELPSGWRAVTYETADFSGKMLLSQESEHAAPLTLQLNAEGWYKIFLGLVPWTGRACLGVTITGEDKKTCVEPENRIGSWEMYGWAEEHFFRAANLTGRNLQIFKPETEGRPCTAALAFVRLVKMTEREIAAYTGAKNGRAAWHFDNDFLSEDDYHSAKECTGRLRLLENAGGGILLYETSFDDCAPPAGDVMPAGLLAHKSVNRRFSDYLARQGEVKAEMLRDAHGMGLSVYAARRMEAGDFFLPYAVPVYNSGIVEKYPAYRCKTRDGREIRALSYAYSEVRKMMRDAVIAPLHEGFDGVSLILHRGVYVAFEQPVLDEVKKRYGVDARRLPFVDERLHTVLCSFMTQFLRELRAEMENLYGKGEKKINVIVFYDVESSKNFGLDVRTWAKEKLVDSVAQGLMTHFENLAGCLGQDGLIDLQKYSEKNGREPVLQRYYGDDVETIVGGAKGFCEVCRASGTEFYGTLGWESTSLQKTAEIAAALESAGVEKFISWNANHKCKKLSLIGMEKQIARGEAPADDAVYRRVLLIDGRDISSFNPNWRG